MTSQDTANSVTFIGNEIILESIGEKGFNLYNEILRDPDYNKFFNSLQNDIDKRNFSLSIIEGMSIVIPMRFFQRVENEESTMQLLTTTKAANIIYEHLSHGFRIMREDEINNPLLMDEENIFDDENFDDFLINFPLLDES